MTNGGDGSGNRTTIASYEGCALDYARSTAPEPGSDDRPNLQRFLDALPAGGPVLEIGSGPGWEADWLEARGVTVRRTDAAAAFVELQRARGVFADVLDIVTDDVGGPYAGAIALYIFQHIDRPLLPDVLGRIASALSPGGAFLFALREGSRDLVERGDSGNTYLIAEWEKPDLDRILHHLGLALIWSDSFTGTDGEWLTMLWRKQVEGD